MYSSDRQALSGNVSVPAWGLLLSRTPIDYEFIPPDADATRRLADAVVTTLLEVSQ